MRIELGEDEAVEVQMAPLIDCVFLLLIFFLVASTLKEIPRELQLELPSASAAATVDARDEPWVIAIDREGVIHIDDNPVEATDLSGRVQSQQADHPDLRVRIDADRRTPYEHVIQVLNELQSQGIVNVGLQTLSNSNP